MLALLAAGCREKIAAPRSADVAGKYVRSGESTSTLEVHADGDRYVAVLSGGGSAAAGPATPADCYVRAVGSIRGDTLVARFTTVETTVFSYDAAQAEREKRTVTIRFAAGDADVLSADTEGYCGLGATFLGHYRRVREH